ncbi:MAG: hypothetical protein WCE63_15855 [Acidobacteriaceae bacterium]
MVFDHALWMFVCLRLLGGEPAAPGDTLVQYATELEIEYCRLRLGVDLRDVEDVDVNAIAAEEIRRANAAPLSQLSPVMISGGCSAKPNSR